MAIYFAVTRRFNLGGGGKVLFRDIQFRTALVASSRINHECKSAKDEARVDPTLREKVIFVRYDRNGALSSPRAAGQHSWADPTPAAH